METITQIVFYTTICICFTDIAFYVIRKFMRFAESLINTKFNFGKINTKIKK